MKHIVISLSFFILTVTAMPAQECSKELDLVNTLLESANLDTAINNPDEISNNFNALKSSASSIGLSSLKKDAPKVLFINGKERTAKIKKGERRIFVTTLVSSEQLNLKLFNPNQQYGIEVVICSHNTKGETLNHHQLVVDENNVSDVIDFNIENLSNSVVSISVRNVDNSERIEFGISAQ